MLYLIISLICQVATGPVFGYAMELMLTPRGKRLTRWMRITLWGLIFLFFVLSQLLDVNYVGTVPYNLVFWIVTGVLAVSFYSDPVWMRLLAYFCLLVGSRLAEIAYYLVPNLYTTGSLSLDYTQPDMMLGCIFAFILSCVGISLVLVVWRKLWNKHTPKFVWIYLILPLCLTIPSLQFSDYAISENGVVSWVSLMSLLASGVSTVFLIVIVFKQAEQESIALELAQIKFQFDLEHLHYQQIDSRREEMAKIRHDYNNILTSVLGLVQMGKDEDAQIALRELLHRVQNTKERRYCGIPIVNALLAEKHKQCVDQGIDLKTDLQISDDCNITSIDLCSVFSNLMDNAIRGCLQVPEHAAPTILLTAQDTGDKIIVNCRNPAAKAPGARPEGTGYGMKILADISRRWGGSFSTAFEDGEFTGCVTLSKNTKSGKEKSS